MGAEEDTVPLCVGHCRSVKDGQFKIQIVDKINETI